MTLVELGWLGLVLFALALSALFSGLEIGVYTLNRVGLAVRVGRGDKRAILLDRELARPDRVLPTLLVGNNIANYLGGLGIAEILDGRAFGPLAAVALNAGLLLPATFLLGETLPKDLFRAFTDRWTYHFGRYLQVWRIALTIVPFVPILGWLGRVATALLGGDRREALVEPRQRITQLVQEGAHAGVLSEGQTTLAERALTLRGRTVGGEMTPWAKVSVVPLGAAPALRSEILRRSGASRLPVVDGQGRVVGVLTALDAILQPSAPTETLMAPPVFFRPGQSALETLRVMRTGRTRLGIVAEAPRGRPIGVIAIKDLVEPLTGQLAGS
jgi:CBS domain containing-hemolysin-like protein